MTHRTSRIESKPNLRSGVTVRLAPWFAMSVMAAAVGMAYAQNVPAPAGAASAAQTAVEKKAADEATAQTITISATRQRELIRDVPLAITAMTTERLTESGAKNLNDDLAAVPGLVLQNSRVLDGVGNIIIRGLTAGTDRNSPTTIYIDDVPMALGSTFDVNLLDQSPFEVLRGPQGTLYGSSALGGVVKYITNEPNTYELPGKVRLGLSQTQHGGLNIADQGGRDSSFEKSTRVPNYALPSCTQLDLSSGVKVNGFDIGVFVRNLTNVRGQLGATTGEQAITGRTYVHVIDPSTIGVNLTAAF
jgi:outer membrane receptor protein involved in Fe transport